jgi:hypothetical protein
MGQQIKVEHYNSAQQPSGTIVDIDSSLLVSGQPIIGSSGPNRPSSPGPLSSFYFCGLPCHVDGGGNVTFLVNNQWVNEDGSGAGASPLPSTGGGQDQTTVHYWLNGLVGDALPGQVPAGATVLSSSGVRPGVGSVNLVTPTVPVHIVPTQGQVTAFFVGYGTINEGAGNAYVTGGSWITASGNSI